LKPASLIQSLANQSVVNMTNVIDIEEYRESRKELSQELLEIWYAYANLLLWVQYESTKTLLEVMCNDDKH